MAQKIEDLILQLIFDDKEALGKISRFDGKMEDLQRQSRKTGQSISQGFTAAKAGILAAVAVIGTVAVAMNKAIGQASKYQEANSKMLTVFSNMQTGARAMRDELVKSYNMSTTAATELLGATGDILTGFGIQQREALNLSGKVQRLAADLASFTNAQGGAKAVSEALTKAMLGERESLKTYGIAIAEADVKQKLYEKGQDKLTGSALRQAKAQATLEIAMSQSKNAIGDLERTQDSYANTQRRLSNSIEDLSLTFGAVFIPIAGKVLSWLVDLVDKIPVDEIVGTLGAVFQIFVEWAERLWGIFSNVGSFIKSLFKGDISGMKEAANGLWESIAKGWEGTADRVVASYHDTQSEYKAFMEGSVEVNRAAQQQIQEQEKEAAKEREERENKEYERKIETQAKEKEFAEKRKEMIAELTANDLENEDARVDYLYESGRIEFNHYVQVLNDRIAYAKAIYGAESMEYMKLVDRKKQLDVDYQKAKQEKDQELFGAYIDMVGGMFAAAVMGNKGMFEMHRSLATTQAIINAIQAASTTFARFGWPLGLPLAAAALAQGYVHVANIRRQSYQPRAYATGGEILKPTMALMGEAGAEVVAPKRDFIQVVNNMIQRGDIGTSPGADNREITSRLDTLEQAIRDTRITSLNIDGIEIARAVERGQIKVNTGKINY